MKRPTKNLLMDAAEKYFAEKGYRSTSMEDIAGDVGIRPSAIYKHFKNKQDLYEAVVDRMVAPFFENLEPLKGSKDAEAFAASVFAYLIENPSLARFALHATLTGGDHRNLLVERWYTPYWEFASKNILGGRAKAKQNAFVAITNTVLGYVTLAPIHGEGLGTDLLSKAALKDATASLKALAAA